MSLKIDRVQLEIIVQQDKARQKMVDLEKQMRNANQQLKALERQFGKNSEQYKTQERVIRNLKQQYDDLFNEIGLGNLSLKELANRQRELNAILRNLSPNTPEWKRYNQQLKEVNARIKELRNEARETGFSLSKVADGFNRYAAIGASAIASLTGMTLTMRKCVDEYATMEEAQSQVIKYTGMTKEEVDDLNESFKQMDTRTSREELNRLAGEAGKLGITGKQDVLEFVDAANQINVALGEDLGEEAVNQIGKLSQMFGDESRSLKDNMLSIGSAVNQVAQSTSASEPYLVSFTARMGGVGKQAKMSVTDIMGFASALDQNMLRSEMASTALSGLIMRIYQEPAKYAKLAGMDVEKFTKLVETDVNQAVLSFLSALNKMGGMAQMAPVLKDMQLSGAEAASVISTLAGNVDLVRQEQENANKAFTEGTSITNEYSVQNNTVQARLEKLQNDFKNIRVELGERLLPVMRYMISTGSLTVKGLMAMTGFLIEYKSVILTITTAIAAYTVVVKAHTIATKALELGTKAATVATRLFNVATKASPWGLVISGVTAVISYFAFFRSETDQSTDSLKRMNGELLNERNAVNHLFESLKNAGDGTERRKELIDEINQRYGEYLPNLLTEKSTLDEIKSAYDRINTSLTQQIALKYKNEDVNKVTEQAAAEQMDSLESLRKSVVGITGSDQEAARFIQDLRAMADAAIQPGEDYRKAVANTMKTLEKEYLTGHSLSSGMKNDITDFMNNVYQLSLAIDDINKKYEGWMPKQDGSGGIVLPEVTVTANKQKSSGSNPLNYDAIKTAEERYKQELEADKNAAKEKQLQQIKDREAEEVIQREYNDALYKAEMAYLAKRKKLLQDNGKDTTEIQGQIYDQMIAEANRLYEDSKKQEADFNQAEFDAVDADAEEQRRAAKQAYIDGDLATEEAYRQRLLEIERNYLQARKALLQQNGMDTSEVDGKLLDLDFQDKKTERKTKREEGFAAIKDTTDLDRQNEILQAMYDQDLITYEEYQENKTRLAEQYEQRRQQITQAALNVIGQVASSASQLIQALQDAEISKVESRYDKEIEAARKAGKDTTKLEEEKEAAVKEVKKKYADAQFAMSVLQVTSSTAVAAMEAYKAMAGIPVVGPALGAAAAAAAVVAGAAQIAVAKQQRDEAKGLKSGGYSADYVEGYTKKGNPNDTAGVIPVHKNEFVANHEAVANPAVKQFLDVFDLAQKRGTIRMLNTTQILEQVRTRSGHYAGGYSSENTGASRPSAPTFAGMSAEQRSQVVALLVENNRLLGILCDKELIIDPRKVRDAINRVNRLEKNVSR